MSSMFFRALAAAALLPFLTARAEPCPDRAFAFFEREGYRTRNVHVTGFWLLPRALHFDAGIATLAGKPFTERGILEGKSKLREQMIAAPALFDSPVAMTVTGARVVNCGTGADGVKELDIEYPVFSTKSPVAGIGAVERTTLEREHPAEGLALAPVKSRFRVTPRAGYDASRKLFAGGRAEFRSRSPSGLRAAIEGEGSDTTAAASASISGLFEPQQSWLDQLAWRGSFAFADRPSDALSLDSYRGLGQISLLTTPFGTANAIFRFGSLFEGGHQRTGLSDSSLQPDLLAASVFANWRTYAGVTARTGRTSMGASYGLLLGRTGSGRLVDYRKQVVDGLYETRFLPARQRPLSIEVRGTAGTLARLGPTPVSERFFGGNAEMPFIPGEEWSFRTNPVMRGIPAYRLNRNGPDQTPGADRFAVLNVTAGIVAFGLTVIPKEAADDPEIRAAVEGFVKDGADSLTPLYELDDPAQKSLFENNREEFAKTAEALEARVRALEASTPEASKEVHATCLEKAGDLAFDAANITKRTPWRVFLNADPEERGIPVIAEKCIKELNGVLKDPELAKLGERMAEHEKTIREQVNKIDRDRARRLAEETLSFPARVLQTVFDEMTVVSVSPVFVFDLGRIAPEAPGSRSTRYSVGGGVRFTLASSVAFEAGYAWNLQPRPWEGRGALFVALRFIDLFGR